MEASEAYYVTQQVHNNLFTIGVEQRRQGLPRLGFSAEIGSASSRTAQRLATMGAIDGRDALQTLSLTANGTYYLTTAFTEYGGEVDRTIIKRDAPFEILEKVVGSLFMGHLIAHALQDTQEQ